jgi:hypothetical protein
MLGRMSATAFLEPIEAGVDHVRGPSSAPVIVEYGDYECPYSRRAFREIERVERAIRAPRRSSSMAPCTAATTTRRA